MSNSKGFLLGAMSIKEEDIEYKSAYVGPKADPMKELGFSGIFDGTERSELKQIKFLLIILILVSLFKNNGKE